jgi:hypothetical protein
MPKVPWHLFQDRQPRAHLVVGAIAELDAPIAGDELTEAQVVLRPSDGGFLGPILGGGSEAAKAVSLTPSNWTARWLAHPG